MSGICGVITFDGSTPALGAILDKLERRGPDATRSWSEGPVALGHTLLATTPEALIEVLPLTNQASGCTITADARLDNREELIAALGLDSETRTLGDGELILRAYLKWNEDCPTHLLGDFAFAIWDPRHERLFCARDHMGMRQLIYHHHPEKIFAFANEADALVAHDGVPKRVNEGRIADFLDNLEGIDVTSTFIDEAFRLPPAHSLTVDHRALSIRRYWHLAAVPELQLDSDEAYTAAFLSVFTEAVRCRLRSAGPVGSMMSGGIDSNSVVAVAASLLKKEARAPLFTFSGVGPDPAACPETRAIRIAAANPGINATLIDYAALDDLEELAIASTRCAEPFDAPMTLHRAIYRAGHRAGTKIMLDGVGGDLALNAGNVVAELLHRRQFTKALRESAWQQWTVPHVVAASRELLSTIWATTVPAALRTVRRRRTWRSEDIKASNGQALINPTFASRIGLNSRRKRYRDRLYVDHVFGQEYRIDCIAHPHLTVGRERYDRVAATFAIEPRDPFLDLRLINFCLSLPQDQLHANRNTKSILRRAMVGAIPAEVIWRRGKEHVGWQFTQAIFPQLLDPEQVFRPDWLGRFVNLKKLRELSRFSTIGIDRLHWFEICIVAYWLAEHFPGEGSIED